MEHMAIKLVLNTISTGVMVCLGRVTGNWMSWVAISNKKLIDRAIRLISEIGGVSYETACYALFDNAEKAEQNPAPQSESLVQVTLRELKRKNTV